MALCVAVELGADVGRDCAVGGVVEVVDFDWTRRIGIVDWGCGRVDAVGGVVAVW